MIVISNIAGAKQRGLTLPTAVTIGNFDGCHLGHQNLIADIIDSAERLRATPVALSFNPRPEAFFKNTILEQLLFSSQQKIRSLRELGLKATVLQRFDEAFSKVEPENFVANFLVQELGASAVAVGSNFRFGHKRSGDVNTLKAYSVSHRVAVHIRESSTHENTIISSSRIRRAIECGDVASAKKMLGRPYLLEGMVVKGDQLGRKLGAPTANLSEVDQLIPAVGVYFVRVFLGSFAPIMQLPSGALPAICSVSLRPTVSLGSALRIETHILSGVYELDSLYGKPLGIYFDDRLREEKKFANLEELRNAIFSDISTARRFYAM